MLYFATFDFEDVLIHGCEADSILPGARIIAFGTDYDTIKLAAEAHARQHELGVVDNVDHTAYIPEPLG